ncbi:MAG: GrdX family protein, partial [Synergistaceae bacterium]|nr:GrdX family protein [Synergistaceae bacterium]
MREEVLLFTNNPRLRNCSAARTAALAGGATVRPTGTRFIDGSPLDVLIAVRDAAHRGAVLLTHPLCGNLRPYQQPFRSVLVKSPLAPT